MGTMKILRHMILISAKLRNSVPKLVILLSLLIAPYFVGAQESVVLSVSPTLFEMTANQSQTWSSSVRVINANPFPITVYTDVVNFEPDGTAGQGTLVPVISTGSDGTTLAEWIAVTQEELVVPAEQTLTVPFTITVPEEAPPGGHFAAILVGTRSLDDADAPAQVETSQVVTSLVFLRVTGDITEAGTIRSFYANSTVTETADMSFSVEFENTGNVHVQPQGEIVITNMWGQERGSIPINKNSQFGNVLPESKRLYTFHWSAEWSLADIGRHKAVVTLAYGDDTRQFVDRTTYYWLIPWKLLLLVLTIIGAFVVLVVWSIKLYVRRMLQLAGVTPELRREPAQKHVSVLAPIESGILDLRNELAHGSGSVLARVATFASRYRVFVLIAAALAVFVGLFVWYVAILVTSDFEYEVEYERADGSVVPVQLETADQQTETDVLSAVLYVVNNSTNPEAVAIVESKLGSLPYVVEERIEVPTKIQDRSVLVYDPELLEDVQALQTVLSGVLVSSYDSPDTTESELLLYIGNDLLE